MKKISPYSPGSAFDVLRHLNDKELWQKFLNEDKEAFAFIYEKYVDELFSYGMKVKHNRSLVKDCIHDLFVELWNRRTFLSATDNIRFYLYRSLRRKIRYVVDREKSLFEDERSYDFDAVQVSHPFEQSIILKQGEDEKKKKIIRVLSRLPARQQEVLKLIFFEDFSYEEVSEIMSINVRSVYTLVWKALSSLRKNISELLIILVTLLLNF